jgi:PPK2 family polyphosphate:nucleotide phosphotransferase
LRTKSAKLKSAKLNSPKSKSPKSKSAKFLRRYRVEVPDCADGGGIDKDAAVAMLAADVKRLADLQERLYARSRWALLIVLQGMDAAGKDSVVAHVMSGVNPQGCDVHSFKAPSAEELDHDFLWRAAARVPAHGRIGIFNRSYYEEVLVVRVHPELLERQKVPRPLIGKRIWQERFQDIRAFERHLARSGTVVLKFFLHVSKEEQRRRLLDRLEEPAKRWKFSMDDVNERKRWGEYMAAYEDMIRATSIPSAPWYVVPADHKWFARLVVAAAVIEALERLELDFPKIEGAALKEMRKVREALEAEHGGRRPKPDKSSRSS